MNRKDNLAELVARGGVYHGVTGSYPSTVLTNVINLLPAFPSFKAETLLQAVLEREALMPTGIGRGVALPHPRTPLLKETDSPFVAINFPAEPLDWNTPDGSKVHTIFLIVSISSKQHLNVLSRINFLCQQEYFRTLIKSQAPKETIITAIREAEASWAG
ncbi:MAG: PTS sugar transporter subunit IIA [Treponema sp.]|nr:PTS sugar transporter subunit IIA [Treponema sp.]